MRRDHEFETGCPVWQEVSDAVKREWQWRNAQWIALPKPSFAEGRRPRYFLARREFELPDPGNGAELHIAADSDFRVFLNGRLVGAGQPRDTVVRVSYRSYDVTELTRQGSNCLAVEVYGSRACVDTDRMAVIAALAVHSNNWHSAERLATDGQWRVRAAPQWDSAADEADSYFRQTEMFTAADEPEGWKLAGFDDATWQPPRIHDTRELYPDLDDSYRPHSQLVPSIVPPVRRELVQPREVTRLCDTIQLDAPHEGELGIKMALETVEDLRHCRFTNPENLLRDADSDAPMEVMTPYGLHDKKGYYRFWEEHPGEMPAVRHATIILDFGEQAVGHLSLDIEGSGGEIVDMAWGQILVCGRVHSKLYHPMKPGGLFGSLGQASRYILKPGRQYWESFHPVPARYLQVTFRNMDQPLRVYRLALVKSSPPLTVRSEFECSSDSLTWSWHAGVNTLLATTQDIYVDNFIRENGAYTGECGGNALATTWAVCGDEPLARHYAGLITAHPETNRFLATTADSWFRRKVEHPHIYHHPMRMSYVLAEYALAIRDEGFVRNEIYPTLTRFIRWNETQCNAAGLIADPPGWNWFDWAETDSAKGECAPQNLLYASMLARTANLAELLGSKQNAATFRDRARQIRDQIYERFWNEEAGLYVDAIVEGRQLTRLFSEHTNFQALGAGLGAGGRTNRIIHGMLSEQLNITESDTMFMDIVCTGLFDSGEAELAMRLMEERYDRFRKAGLNTLCEEFSPWMTMRLGRWISRFRAIAQSAACTPPYVLNRAVLGVRPVAMGFRRCRIAPQPGMLEWARGKVPTPLGDIEVHWRIEEGRMALNVNIPDGMSAELVLPGDNAGRPHAPPTSSPVEVGPGEHRIEATWT